MATTNINITTNTRHGADLSQAIIAGTNFRSKLRELKAEMETMIDSSDYTLVETRFGLAAGEGETTYNLVAGALTDLEGANINQLLIRLG